jgi:ubiquinone/menaquinone biosynthesis C-methylase UbiE
MPAYPPAAREIKNAAWSVAGVQGQYSDSSPHADLYRFLNQWIDMELYLNVGYTRFGQRHLRVENHLRLIDRLADGLMALHASGPYSAERRLLDVGSGRGGAAIRARRKWGLEVLGIDITLYNVRLAGRNALKEGVAQDVTFQLGDAHRLPLADASFPLAWSIESPAHFADKPAFLRELGRVVKPGGAITFADLLVGERVVTASEENLQIYRDFLRVWDVPYLETFDSYVKAVAEAGFDLRRSEIVTRHNLDIYRRRCGLFLRLLRFRPLYRAYGHYLRDRTGANLDNVHEHVLKSYRALRRGMIDYGLFWAVRR